MNEGSSMQGELPDIVEAAAAHIHQKRLLLVAHLGAVHAIKAATVADVRCPYDLGLMNVAQGDVGVGWQVGWLQGDVVLLGELVEPLFDPAYKKVATENCLETTAGVSGLSSQLLD